MSGPKDFTLDADAIAELAAGETVSAGTLEIISKLKAEEAAEARVNEHILTFHKGALAAALPASPSVEASSSSKSLQVVKLKDGVDLTKLDPLLRTAFTETNHSVAIIEGTTAILPTFPTATSMDFSTLLTKCNVYISEEEAAKVLEELNSNKHFKSIPVYSNAGTADFLAEIPGGYENIITGSKDEPTVNAGDPTNLYRILSVSEFEFKTRIRTNRAQVLERYQSEAKAKWPVFSDLLSWYFESPGDGQTSLLVKRQRLTEVAASLNYSDPKTGYGDANRVFMALIDTYQYSLGKPLCVGPLEKGVMKFVRDAMTQQVRIPARHNPTCDLSDPYWCKNDYTLLGDQEVSPFFFRTWDNCPNQKVTIADKDYQCKGGLIFVGENHWMAFAWYSSSANYLVYDGTQLSTGQTWDNVKAHGRVTMTVHAWDLKRDLKPIDNPQVLAPYTGNTCYFVSALVLMACMIPEKDLSLEHDDASMVAMITRQNGEGKPYRGAVIVNKLGRWRLPHVSEITGHNLPQLVPLHGALGRFGRFCRSKTQSGPFKALVDEEPTNIAIAVIQQDGNFEYADAKELKSMLAEEFTNDLEYDDKDKYNLSDADKGLIQLASMQLNESLAVTATAAAMTRKP